ncbi:MAG TPA: GGDEF domain-containing response regulator [Gallionellaceae bacterium]|nr:GGDEF domain-containing response regulator [Gallionellaceae bacterium]
MYHRKLLRVLFVEDSEDDMELLLDTLHREYGEIQHQRVDTAIALRAVLQQEKWDVILCDHNMPGLDSSAALRIVRNENMDIPFIIVSALIEEEIALATLKAGAADAIAKGNLSRLVPAIEREMIKSSTMQDLKLAREQINRIAYYDQLTGLPNREFIVRKVNQLLKRSPAPDKFALLVININRFLQIPRSLGIDAANRLLQIMGSRIKDGIGEAGFVARLGGDRFAVLLPEVEEQAQLLQRIAKMNEHSSEALNIAGQELFLTCSVGISVYPEGGRDFHELFINAETAMNMARTEGGCRYRFFERGMNESGQERLLLEHALHRAIKHQEFLLHYQPQLDLRSGRITGVEALLRWQLPEGNMVSPAKFIPLLEETGLIVSVGEWALTKACEQNRAWQQAGLPPIRMAVNLSAIQFQQTDPAAMVRRVLHQTGLEPCYLELEITENIAMHNEETIIRTLGELRDMGISLAIDDFGTGYSSLSYLKRFPLHKLKIDRSFVNDIGDQANGSSLVKAIISLAQNLGLKVIAEGVETATQSSFLSSCGCEQMQGYLFSKPVAADKIARLINTPVLANSSVP